MHNNIMAAGSKERPPMLGPGRYSQWHSRFLRYLDTKSNGEYLRKCIFDGPYLPTNVLIAAVEAAENILPVAAHEEVETIHNMTAENKLYFQAEKEAIFLILTGIGDEIYSTVDACNTAKEMWTAIERLQQGESLNVQDVKTNLFWEFGKFTSRDGESMESYYSRFYKLMNELTRNNLQVSPMQVNVQFLQQLQPEWSRFVTVVKQRQEIDTVSYHKLFDVLKQFQNEVNDIRSERLARSANPLALLAAAQPYSDNYYQAPKPQRSSAPSYMQSSSTRPSASTRHKGKEIAKPVTPQSESVSEEDSDPEQARRDKDMKKNLALLAKYFKKLYKPTNNNLRTSSNSRNKTECRKPKRVKDYAYHKEKMMMCKQAEQGVPLQAEQADWLEDTDEEIDEQELEAHYSYMAKIQEVSPEESSSTGQPLEQSYKGYKPKRKANKSVATPHKKTVASDTTIQKSKSYYKELYENTNQEWKWWIAKRCPSGYTWTQKPLRTKKIWMPKIRKADESTSISPTIDIVSRITNIVQLILFIVDSGCTKHMTGNLTLLCNFVEKFLGTVRFGNDQFAPILGYGDLIQGNVTIKRVYYVEGLNHNLFSVGQFCDADLEVAFRKSTCFVRDLQGNDLLTGSRGSDLYTISLQETTSSTPICFMAKASPTQAWLWHRRLSHLNFDYITLLSKKEVVNGLPKLKYVKDQLCSSCEMSKAKRSSFKSKVVPSSKGRLNLLHMDLCGPMRVASINGKKYILVIVDDYSRYTWTLFLRSKDETPETLHAYFKEEGIEHQTSTRTMLSASKLPLSFWAEAVATACYTQNRSIIISTHGKTAYHIINDRKPSIKHLHIFGCTCYITRDGENLDKMKEKGDPCVMVGYSTQSKGYRVYNKRTRLIVESIHIKFDEIIHMTFEHSSSSLAPQGQNGVC
ncbi:retrovirus-related pol polyprotein from transposon TNT 1-94 [Tanacetum coccineum]